MIPGAVIAIGLIATVSGPSSLGTPASQQNAVAAAAALVFVFVPQASLHRAKVAALWAFTGAAVAVVAAQFGTPEEWFAEPALIATLGAVIGVTASTLPIQLPGQSDMSELPLRASQTLWLALRQSVVGFALIMTMILYWGARSVH